MSLWGFSIHFPLVLSLILQGILKVELLKNFFNYPHGLIILKEHTNAYNLLVCVSWQSGIGHVAFSA